MIPPRKTQSPDVKVSTRRTIPIGSEMSVFRTLLFGLLLSSLTRLTLGEMKTLFLRKDSLETAHVLYTDGTLRNEPVDPQWRACGIGSHVFLQKPRGGCYSSIDLQVKPGEANQITDDPNRRAYHGRVLTIVEAHKSIFTSAAEVAALTRGEIVDARNQLGTEGTVNATFNGYLTRIELEPASRAFDMTKTGVFCDFDTAICHVEAVSGVRRKVFFYSRGAGLKIVGVGDPSNLIRIVADAGSLSRLCPMRDEVRAAYPIAVTVKDFFTTRLLVVGDNSGIIPRIKRQLISIGIVSAAGALFDKLKSDTKTVMEGVDSNYLTLENQTDLLLSLTKDIEAKGFETGLINSQIDRIVLESTVLNDGLEETVYALSAQGVALTTFILELTDYMRTEQVYLMERDRQLREKAKAKYPGCTILAETSAGEFMAYAFRCGNLYQGPAKGVCLENTCTLDGVWNLMTRPGMTQSVNTPILTPLTCGFYWKTTDLQVHNIIAEQSTFPQLRSNSDQTNTEYAYVNEVFCPEGLRVPQADQVGTLNDHLHLRGLPALTQVASDQYVLNCSENGTHPFGDHLCGQRLDLETLRGVSKNIPRFDFEAQATKYSTVDPQAALASLGELGKALAQVPIDLIQGMLETARNIRIDKIEADATVAISLAVIAFAFSATNLVLVLMLKNGVFRRSPGKGLNVL